jgi:hypothetical protein
MISRSILRFGADTATAPTVTKPSEVPTDAVKTQQPVPTVSKDSVTITSKKAMTEEDKQKAAEAITRQLEAKQATAVLAKL